MHISRVKIEFSSGNLVHNLDVLSRASGGLKLIPMIKANAYGHGDIWAAKTILEHRKDAVEALGVATVPEAIGLRKSGVRSKIIVFSGCSGQPLDEVAAAAKKFSFIFVISSLDDLKKLSLHRDARALPIHIKFDTGMNRLGIAWHESDAALRILRGTRFNISGVLSHLAKSTDLNSPLTRLQLKRFAEIRNSIRNLCGESVKFHIANSGGIFHSKLIGAELMGDFVRPGVSLYGASPAPDFRWGFGLRPVMKLLAKVIQIKFVLSGEGVGYDGTYRVPRGARPTRTAVLGCGYGDGIPRSLSSRGFVFDGGRKLEVLGRVSMDLTSVRAHSRLKVGDWVEWFGGKIDPWHQALRADTIPYELWTGISNRVERVYR